MLRRVLFRFLLGTLLREDMRELRAVQDDLRRKVDPQQDRDQRTSSAISRGRRRIGLRLSISD